MFYKIQFVPHFLDSSFCNYLSEESSYFSEGSKASPFTTLFLRGIQLINKFYSNKETKFLLIDQEIKSILDAPAILEEDLNVHVYFYDKPELAKKFGMTLEDASFHALKAGIFSNVDRSEYSKEHRIFIRINDEFNINYGENERKREIKVLNTDFDEDYLINIFSHLVREVVYVVEFIEYAHGLYPDQIVKRGLDPMDFSLGIYSNKDVREVLSNYNVNVHDNLKNNLIYDMMTDRVEEKTRLVMKKMTKIYATKEWLDAKNFLTEQVNLRLDKKPFNVNELFFPEIIPDGETEEDST